jgi:CheY-like chemotaxis protein
LIKPIDWARLSGILREYGGQSPGRVLIVDDEPVNREVLRRMVAKAGWSVAEAANGRSALTLVAEAPPDLILLDLMMPEMDGFEFVRLLAKTAVGRSIPIVVVSAKQLTEDDRRQLSGSVQRVLQKGAFTREELLQELRTLVSSARSRREQRSARPVGQDGASVEVAQLQSLREQVAQLQAERDALLVERRTDEKQQEGAARLGQLEEELELARFQIREQQQSVEMMRAECEDTQAQLAAMQGLQQEAEELREDLRRVRGERDGTLSRPRKAASAASTKTGSKPVRAKRAALARESQPGGEPPRTSGGKGEGPRSSPRSDKPDCWYLGYKDAQGKPCTMTGSTEEVRQWLAMGLLENAERVRASQEKTGPFQTLDSYEEFRDLLQDATKPSRTRSTNGSPGHGPARVKTPVVPPLVRPSSPDESWDPPPVPTGSELLPPAQSGRRVHSTPTPPPVEEEPARTEPADLQETAPAARSALYEALKWVVLVALAVGTGLLGLLIFRNL